MNAILPLNSKTRKAINDEINRQTGENVRNLSINLQALVLWAVHEEFDCGKKKLLQFQKKFLPLIQELQDHYQLENASETEFVCLHKLKNEVGIDVENLNEMFQLEVKMK